MTSDAAVPGSAWRTLRGWVGSVFRDLAAALCVGGGMGVVMAIETA